MTKKKHEELVNEIAGELNTLFCAGRDGGIPKQLPQVLAESLITLILSALRDGRLDEELGMVGRWYLVGERWKPRYWTAEPRGVEGEKTIIALRKKEDKDE